MPVDKHRNDQLFAAPVKFVDTVDLDADVTGATTKLLLVDTDGTAIPVTLGVNDSGGTGFRALVIPN